MDVIKSINQFLKGNGKNKGRKPEERYASLDYFYNLFIAISIMDQKLCEIDAVNYNFASDDRREEIEELMN